MFLVKGHEKKILCLNYGTVIKSIVNNNKYYMTRKNIYVVNSENELIKKLTFPRSNDPIIDERMIEFWDMRYLDLDLFVLIKMRSTYDCKTILDENSLEYGNITPYK